MQILRLAHIIHYLIVYSEHHNLTTVVWYQKLFFITVCTHPQVFRDVDEFVSSSDLEKCSIASVSQQWMLCSEWVPSE